MSAQQDNPMTDTTRALLEQAREALNRLVHWSEGIQVAKPAQIWPDGRALIEAIDAHLAAGEPEPLQAAAQPEEVEAIIACLEDDAATLRAENDDDEMAVNMDSAARLLSRMTAASPKTLANDIRSVGSTLREIIPALPLESANAVQVQLNRLDEVAASVRYIATPLTGESTTPAAPDRAYAAVLLSAASKSGNPAAIALAAQLADVMPCETCGFVWTHCRCATPTEAAPAEPFQRAIEIRVAQGWKLTGKAVPILYTDTINDEQVCRDDLWLATSDALYAHPPAPEATSTRADPRNSAGETPTEHAHRWATELATHMASKFYPEAPQWKPLPDLLGVITQIDNMVTGLVRAVGEIGVTPTGWCKSCGPGNDRLGYAHLESCSSRATTPAEVTAAVVNQSLTTQATSDRKALADEMRRQETLHQFERAVARCAVLHDTHQGKVMSEAVYDTFATLRDDTLPALRKEILDRLAAAPLPAGWRMVPEEPTPAMVQKAMRDCGAIGGGSCGEHTGVDWDDLRSVYEAMLAAAPPLPPAEQPKGDAT